MELLLYGIVKFIAYSGWGYAGFRLQRTAAPLFGKSVRFGIAPWKDKWTSPRLYTWIICGAAVSFLTDMVSPEMLNEGRFCVGRCLC